MKDAWIVVRKERHIDDKFWVCFTKEDALQIAADVTRYWQNEYILDSGAVDKTCYGDWLFYYDVEGAFRVYVQPQLIREAGEPSPLGTTGECG